MDADIKEELEKQLTPEKLAMLKQLTGDWRDYRATVRIEPNCTVTCAVDRVYNMGGRDNAESVAYFRLGALDGNSLVVVSHNVHVAEALRNRGIGKALLAIREAACKAAGATMMLATVRLDNAAENKVLVQSGWMPGAQAGDIRIWTKGL